MNNMRRGFTMIELIFVIVIIGILAAVAIPKLAATRDDAKISATVANLRILVGDAKAKYLASKGDATFKNLNWSDVTTVPRAEVADDTVTNTFTIYGESTTDDVWGIVYTPSDGNGSKPMLTVTEGATVSIAGTKAQEIAVKKGILQGTSPFTVELGGQGVDFD